MTEYVIVHAPQQFQHDNWLMANWVKDVCARLVRAGYNEGDVRMCGGKDTMGLAISCKPEFAAKLRDALTSDYGKVSITRQ